MPAASTIPAPRAVPPRRLPDARAAGLAPRLTHHPCLFCFRFYRPLSHGRMFPPTPAGHHPCPPPDGAVCTRLSRSCFSLPCPARSRVPEHPVRTRRLITQLNSEITSGCSLVSPLSGNTFYCIINSIMYVSNRVHPSSKEFLVAFRYRPGTTHPRPEPGTCVFQETRRPGGKPNRHSPPTFRRYIRALPAMQGRSPG